MILAMKKKCRHCKTAHVGRPKGLCWACYYKPDVRALYPPAGKYGERGLCAPENYAPQPATFPTDAPPGTVDKIEMMHLRAALGEHIHHPDDAR